VFPVPIDLLSGLQNLLKVSGTGKGDGERKTP
jgi:hypothetical protein